MSLFNEILWECISAFYLIWESVENIRCAIIAFKLFCQRVLDCEQWNFFHRQTSGEYHLCLLLSLWLFYFFDVVSVWMHFTCLHSCFIYLHPDEYNLRTQSTERFPLCQLNIDKRSWTLSICRSLFHSRAFIFRRETFHQARYTSSRLWVITK